ncbi:MAG: glycosyltransferase [Candidatus Competibacteraceae bacterium]|nr:glycosyltransferase [Candidatus Competibacteraceae bacterium]
MKIASLIHLVDHYDPSSCRTLATELFDLIGYSQQYCITMKPFVLGELACPISIIYERDVDVYHRIVQFDYPFIIYHRSFRDDLGFLSSLAPDIPLIVIHYKHASDKLNIPYASRNATFSEAIRSSLADRGVEATLIPPPLRTGRFEAVEPKLRQHGKYLLTGRVNNLNSSRYSEEWFKFMSAVRLATPFVHEHIGGGPYFARAKAVVKTLKGQDNAIRLLGPIDSFEEKVSLLKSWDLFLYQTVEPDAVSASILESFACGVPVLCSDNSINRSYIIKGETGFLYRDLRELGEIMRRLSADRLYLDGLKERTAAYFRDMDSTDSRGDRIHSVIDSVCDDYSYIRLRRIIHKQRL